LIENSWWGLIEFTQERVDELSVLVRTIRAKMDLGLSEETKRTIIDLLDVEVHITTEGEAKYADVTCHLILDMARLLVAGVEDVRVHNTDKDTGHTAIASFLTFNVRLYLAA
jgi:hypothetical protein